MLRAQVFQLCTLANFQIKPLSVYDTDSLLQRMFLYFVSFCVWFVIILFVLCKGYFAFVIFFFELCLFAHHVLQFSRSLASAKKSTYAYLTVRITIFFC